MLADSTSPEADERLAALQSTNDGFVLAEKDLELRGPGEFFGTRQSGLPEFRMAQLSELVLLQKARQDAQIPSLITTGAWNWPIIASWPSGLASSGPAVGHQLMIRAIYPGHL